MTKLIEPTGAAPPVVRPVAVEPVRAPAIQPAAPIPPEVAAPTPPPVDVTHAEAAAIPSPAAPQTAEGPGETTAGRLHDALDSVAHGHAAVLPPGVKQAREMREKAATMVAQGVPPLQLDPQRGLESEGVTEDDSGDSALRVERKKPRKRHKRQPR